MNGIHGEPVWLRQAAFWLSLVGLAAIAFLPLSGSATEAASSSPRLTWALPPGSAAAARAVTGDVQWSTGRGSEWYPVKPGDLLPAGTLVRTGQGAILDLTLGPGREVRLREQSLLALAPPEPGEGTPTNLFLMIGRVWVNLRRALSPGERFTVKTPVAIVGVRGTLFTVAVAPDGGTVTAVLRGQVEVAAAGRTVPVESGQEMLVQVGGLSGEPRPLSEGEQEAGEQERSWMENEFENGAEPDLPGLQGGNGGESGPSENKATGRAVDDDRGVHKNG